MSAIYAEKYSRSISPKQKRNSPSSSYSPVKEGLVDMSKAAGFSDDYFEKLKEMNREILL
jgi:hypothetical protein